MLSDTNHILFYTLLLYSKIFHFSTFSIFNWYVEPRSGRSTLEVASDWSLSVSNYQLAGCFNTRVCSEFKDVYAGRKC